MQSVKGTNVGGSLRRPTVQKAKNSSHMDVLVPSIQGINAKKLGGQQSRGGPPSMSNQTPGKAAQPAAKITMASSGSPPQEQQDLLNVPTLLGQSLKSQVQRATKSKSPTSRQSNQPRRGTEIQKKQPPIANEVKERETIKAGEFKLNDDDMEFDSHANAKVVERQLASKQSEPIMHMVPTAQCQQISMPGLTDIRTGSDILSSEHSSCSSYFEADTNQDLRSIAANSRRNDYLLKTKDFSQIISEETNQVSSTEDERKLDANIKISPLDEESKDYDLEAADKKQRQVQYISQFLSKDIGYTLQDVESIQRQNDAKALGATAKVREESKNLGKKVDALMARMIEQFDFRNLPPVAEEEDQSK